MEEEKVGASAKVHLEIEVVTVENPESLNFILGQAHFIKTVEDIYEVMVQSSTAVKFGLAFCEASGERLIRWDGNDDDLIKLAKTNATRIGAGHSFIIFMRNAYPISVLPALKRVPEVATVFCASANPVQVLIGKTFLGRGIMGVIDGEEPLGRENEQQQKDRQKLLRRIGYKRG